MTATAVRELTRARAAMVPAEFLVLWQDDGSREYHRIGRLSHSDSGYKFVFDSSAPALSERTSFAGLAEFPDWTRTYRSEELFPTFANRVMTPRRDSYRDYLLSLGFGADQRPAPFEVLARTLGARVTDRFQVLPVPVVQPDGVVAFEFLLHGGRHVDKDSLKLAKVSAGDQLHLVPEPGNDFSDVAVLVGTEAALERDTALGYVPNPLAKFVRHLLNEGIPVVATAAHVQVPQLGEYLGSDHMRLLVRVDAVVPDGFDPEQYL